MRIHNHNLNSRHNHKYSHKNKLLHIQNILNILNMNLYNGSDFLLGVKLNTKMLSGNISVPSSFSNIEDGEAMQNWLSGLSFDTVLSNLRKAGVASDLVDMLQTAIEQNMDF
jgi:hypothetical protein